jgi:NADH-quinone oxidoreductase subunit D
MGVYLLSDGTDTAYRCRFRSPSFVNLQALPVLAQGHLIADVVTLIGSIDIVLGCVDR